jgi:hypothetical protein
VALAADNAGKRRLASSATIAITTSNSTSVNPKWLCGRFIDPFSLLVLLLVLVLPVLLFFEDEEDEDDDERFYRRGG